jgi:hypothetical protein
MVPGRILGCSCCDGEETSRYENETCLEAAGPPGRSARPSHLGPGGLSRHLGLPGVASTAVHALRRLTAMISSHCPTWRVKARGSLRGRHRTVVEGGGEGEPCRHTRPRQGGR